LADKPTVLVASCKVRGKFQPHAELSQQYHVIPASLRAYEADETHPYWRDVLKENPALGAAIISDSTSIQNSPAKHLLHSRKQLQDEHIRIENRITRAVSRVVTPENPYPSDIRGDLSRALREAQLTEHEEADQHRDNIESVLLENPPSSEGVALAAHLKATQPGAKLILANLKFGKEAEYGSVTPDAIHRAVDSKDSRKPTPLQLLQQALDGVSLPPITPASIRSK